MSFLELYTKIYNKSPEIRTYMGNICEDDAGNDELSWWQELKHRLRSAWDILRRGD